MVNFFFKALALAAVLSLLALALMPVGMSLAMDLSLWSVVGLVFLSLLPGKTARLFFLSLCAWVVIRYFGWRIQTLPLDGMYVEAASAIALLMAETYGISMLLLGLFVNAWPFDRQPAALPADKSTWPTVDIYIPTYSEPISVVSCTLLAAIEVDYPKDKFNVYILDDGWPRSQNPKTDPEQAMELATRTQELKDLCLLHGATWLSRAKNEHAKSGNMNSAMLETSGELILVLDADHVPTRNILMNTVGLLARDPKMAFVQTPHFFLNADPVEKNLELFNRMPGENDMFYRAVQKGLDLWNTSFFCGSAAILRRTAIADVGGFSIDSITEDASTSVKMHQKGWKSAYIGIPMVAGLQPETFAGFTVQRLRWAMGMMQILIKQNPLIIRGLSMPQRMAYLSVIMFWLFPFARVTFFVAPFFSIFLNLTIYPIGVDLFYANTVPYLVAVVFSFQKMFGKVRRILISELYETLQAFYTLPALISTLMRPNAPTFKVTPKGERLDKEFISEFNKPFYIFYGATVLGIIGGVTRMVMEPDARNALMLSVSWLFLNFVLLSGALGVLLEKVQRRGRPRILMNERITVSGVFGKRDAILEDMSETTARIRIVGGEVLGNFDVIVGDLTLHTEVIESRVATLGVGLHVVRFIFPTPEAERQAVVLGYGSSDRWQALWNSRESTGNFGLSALGVVVIALKGGKGLLSKLLADVR